MPGMNPQSNQLNALGVDFNPRAFSKEPLASASDRAGQFRDELDQAVQSTARDRQQADRSQKDQAPINRPEPMPRQAAESVAPDKQKQDPSATSSTTSAQTTAAGGSTDDLQTQNSTSAMDEDAEPTNTLDETDKLPEILTDTIQVATAQTPAVADGIKAEVTISDGTELGRDLESEDLQLVDESINSLINGTPDLLHETNTGAATTSTQGVDQLVESDLSVQTLAQSTDVDQQVSVQAGQTLEDQVLASISAESKSDEFTSDEKNPALENTALPKDEKSLTRAQLGSDGQKLISDDEALKSTVAGMTDVAADQVSQVELQGAVSTAGTVSQQVSPQPVSLASGEQLLNASGQSESNTSQVAQLTSTLQDLAAQAEGGDVSQNDFQGTESGASDNNLFNLESETLDSNNLDFKDLDAKSSNLSEKQLAAALLEMAPAAAKGAQGQQLAGDSVSSQPISGTSSAADAKSQLTQPTLELSIAKTVDSPDWSNKVFEKVRWMASAEQQTAEIRLDPPDLGPLKLEVSVSKDQAHVTMTSHSSQVREILDQYLPRLREMLQSQGFEFVDAQTRDGQQNQPDQAQQQRRSGQMMDEETVHETIISVEKASKGGVDCYI